MTCPISSMDEREIARMIGARIRAKPTHRGWRCPSAEQIAAYVEQHLAAEDKARFERHLSRCDYCLDLVGSLVRQQSAEQAEVPPGLVRAATDAVPKRASAAQSWRWFLAPTLAGIVVASAILLKSPRPAQVPVTDVPPRPAAHSATLPQTTPPENSRPATADSQSTSVANRKVRSLKAPATDMKLLEPRAASALRSEKLRFRWTSVASAAYYEIRIVNSEGEPVWRGESAQSTAQLPPALSLPPGKYFVWVRAHLSDGRTAKSDTVVFEIRDSS